MELIIRLNRVTREIQETKVVYTGYQKRIQIIREDVSEKTINEIIDIIDKNEVSPKTNLFEGTK